MIDQELRERLEKGLARGFTLDLGTVFVNWTRDMRNWRCRWRTVSAIFTEWPTAVFSIRCWTLLPALRCALTATRVVTLTGTVNYLVAGKESSCLLAKARVVRKGGHTAVVSAEVFDDKGTLLANGSFTFYVLRD